MRSTARIKWQALLGLMTMLAVAGCGDTSPPPKDGPSAAQSSPAVTTEPGSAATDVPPSEVRVDQEPAAENSPATAQAGGAREIEWDALVPDDYRPDKIMAEYDLDALSDDDPRATELAAKLRELWDQAPVRPDLDGVEIKLPGFVVPVEGDTGETTSFLLVPYYGACVHVPPPPANQTVFVATEPGKGTRPGLFDVVWVTGTMSVNRVENDVAEAGYTLYASDIAPYE